MEIRNSVQNFLKQKSDLTQKTKKPITPITPTKPSQVKVGALDFFREIPSATRTVLGGIGGFAKSIFLEYPARAAASLTLGVQEEARGGVKTTLTPRTPVEKFFLGKDEIKSVQQRVKDAQKIMKDIGISSSATDFSVGTVPVLPMLAISGSMFIDLTTFGGKKRTFVKALQKTNKAADTFKLLKRVGVADDIARAYAPKFAKLKKVKDIEKGVNSLNNLIKTTRGAQPTIGLGGRVVSDITPAIKPTAKAIKGVEPGIPGIEGLRKVGLAPEPSPLITKRETTLLKDKIKTLSRGVREGQINTRQDILSAGKDLENTLKSMGVDPEDMKHFTVAFRDIRGKEDLIRKLPELTARAERISNIKEVKRITGEIQKELKVGMPKIGKRKVLEGKIGAEAQNQIDFLRGKKDLIGRDMAVSFKKGEGLHIEGSRIQAQRIKETTLNKYALPTDGVFQEIPESVLKKAELLDMVGIQDMNARELERVLQNIKSIKETGRTIEALRAFNKGTELQRIKDTARMEMTDFNTLIKKARVVGEESPRINPILKGIHAMEDVLLSVSGVMEKATHSKTFKTADFFTDKIREARNLSIRTGAEWQNIKAGKFKEIFGEKNLGKIYNNLNTEKVVFKGKNAFGEAIEMKLSQMEAAYWYSLMKDPTNIRMFSENMGFTPKMFDSVDKFLDPKMKKYADFLQEDWLRKTIRPPVSKRYAEKFHTALADNPFYFPRKYADTGPMEDLTNLFIGDSFPGLSSTLPSGIRARVGSRIGFKKESIEAVMRNHQEQMNLFISFDEIVSDMRRVFMDKDVKNSIIQSADGIGIYKTLMGKIDDIARGGTAAQMTIGGLDKFLGNFKKATMMLNWAPFVKQLTSLPAWTMGRKGIGYTELVSGSMAYSKEPIKWTQMFAKESDFIFGRITKGWTREASLALRQGDKAYTLKEANMTLEGFLKQSIITPTRGGDMIPILPGLTAKYIQTTNKLKKTTKLSGREIHKRALAAAEDLAMITQQSPWIEDLGRIQTANSLGKAISAFATTPIQYLRESTSAMRMWNRGQITRTQAIRTLFTSWVVLPQLFQFASNGFTWNNERQMRAAILGPINYYPAVGNTIGLFYDAFSKGETWKNMESAISPLLSIPATGRDVALQLGKILDTDIDDEKRMEAFGRFARNLYKLTAQLSGRLPSEAPRTIDGIIDLIKGDTSDWRRLIFSEWALKGDEEDEPLKPGTIRGLGPLPAPRTSPESPGGLGPLPKPRAK